MNLNKIFFHTIFTAQITLVAAKNPSKKKLLVKRNVKTSHRTYFIDLCLKTAISHSEVGCKGFFSFDFMLFRSALAIYNKFDEIISESER